MLGRALGLREHVWLAHARVVSLRGAQRLLKI
jgi:hypothetical protein